MREIRWRGSERTRKRKEEVEERGERRGRKRIEEGERFSGKEGVCKKKEEDENEDEISFSSPSFFPA